MSETLEEFSWPLPSEPKNDVAVISSGVNEKPSVSGVTRVPASGNPAIDGLIAGLKYTKNLTYSFPDSSLKYANTIPERLQNFSPVSLEQAQAARFILEGSSSLGGSVKMTYGSVEQITNLALTDFGFNASDIQFAQSASANPTAYAYYPNTGGNSGDIWFGNAFNYRNPRLGDYSYHTHLHEVGHALGLKHGHENKGVADVPIPATLDGLEFSVMTYKSVVGKPPGSGYTNGPSSFPQTYMMLDIAALQYLYGADYGFNSTDTIYKWSQTSGEMFINGVGQGTPVSTPGSGLGKVFLTIWDGGGLDTYDMSNYANGVFIDLNPGGWSKTSVTQQAQLGVGVLARGNVFNSLLNNDDYRSAIENAIGGAGDDIIVGNNIANRLIGGAGNDSLRGLDGNDTLVGGAGSNMLDGGSGIDMAEFGGVRSAYTLSFEPETRSFIVIAPEGRQTLTSVEKVRFSDGELAIEDAVSTMADWVYRMYNTLNGAHLYTASANEAITVRETLRHFNDEGVAFKAAASGVSSTQDIFRFYNKENGAHLYTMSEVERDWVMNNLNNMQFEGVAYKAYNADLGPQEELYRLYNTKNGAHLYTHSEFERDEVMRTLPHFNYEGVAFFVDV